MKKYVGLLCVVVVLSVMICACGSSGRDIEKNNTGIDETTITDTEAKENESVETRKSERTVTTENKGKVENESKLGEKDAELPGPDVVELVNLRGDETTAYKLADGTYMDRIDKKYLYNGTDGWFDEDGVEWNEKVD